METVVYLLGAGFSAPLGLPVMRNFREKSQDMYFDNVEKYAYFTDVFDTIKDLSVVKNFFNTDLYNIEEILSILEMDYHLKGRRLRESFARYIADVVAYYTPQIPLSEPSEGWIWQRDAFGSNSLWSLYGHFVASLLNLKFIFPPKGPGMDPYSFLIYKDVRVNQPSESRVRYSIVTLNYDLIPETMCALFSDTYDAEAPIRFSSELDAAERELAPGYKGQTTPSIAKLHGSVDTGVIVPPTWNKTVYSEIMDAWRLAYRLLADASQLRIIGYSLPTADAYIRFLLKSAIKDNKRLKAIDVLCRDSSNAARARYDEFIAFHNYRFVNGDVYDYLNDHAMGCLDAPRLLADNGSYCFNQQLEKAHTDFFTGRVSSFHRIVSSS